MTTTTKPRNWSKHYDDSHRHRTLRQCIVVSWVAASFGGWFTVEDCYRRFRDEIGTVSSRTIRRYVDTLEQIGALDIASDRDGRGLRYRWIGWPGPVINTNGSV